MQVGSWQKICDLGSGAFGVVSLWKNNENDEHIAIKMCRFKTNNSLTTKQKERWNNEVDIMKIINHPNIIKFKDIPNDLQEFLLKINPTKLPLLPMEYCSKGNLRHVLSKPQNISGMEEDEVRYILEDISKGLQHLHNLNITHRDIKPDNIVVQHCDSRKTKTIYKIIDLGYAKELGDSTVSFVGTLYYLAPEIFEAKNYNNSVDYWSMGILTFEIICGVLPFLATLTPFERFEKIKKKGPEDICIYYNYSGQLAYSTEIKKENLISNCLKQDIEIWLRHVLTYDQNVRSENFQNNTKTLEYLNNVLKKKIVNVFSLYKLEFYSYEITEGTLIGTLKDWISRDIKVPKTDLLLLISKEAFIAKDNDLLSNVMKDSPIYIASKCFLPGKIIYNFPKLIREVMKSAVKFNKKFIKPLKSQVIYFLSIEKITAQHFKASFHLYLNFLNYMLSKIKNLKIITLSKVNQLITKIECYNKMKITNNCDIDLRNNSKYRECLNYSQRLISSLERSVNNFTQLDKKIKCVDNKLKALSSVTPKIQNIVESYDLSNQYKKSITLIEKSNEINNIAQVTEFICDITKVVSETIKIKEAVFRNKELKAFSNVIGNIMCHCFKLIKWIQDYNNHNEDLLKCFEQNEADHFSILLKSAAQNQNCSSESISDQNSSIENFNQELLSLPASYLILQNQELRYNFEDILSTIALGKSNLKEDF